MKMKITEDMTHCIICGNPAVEVHHIFGGPNRRNAGEDELVVPLCREHHNMGTPVKMSPSVHQKADMMKLFHMLGQLAFERNYLADVIANMDAGEEYSAEDAIEESVMVFRNRYGRNYL